MKTLSDLVVKGNKPKISFMLGRCKVKFSFRKMPYICKKKVRINVFIRYSVLFDYL